MDLSNIIKDIEKTMKHEVVINAVIGLIEADVLQRIPEYTPETSIKGFIGLLDDDKFMADSVIDSMVEMFPTGHKYEEFREEAAIQVTKRISVRTNLLKAKMGASND